MGIKVKEKPVNLTLNERGELIIAWSDAKSRSYRVSDLRDNCPCATCREKRRQEPAAPLLPVLSMEETQPLKISGMRPVGSYAYNIAFSDGHDSGIYTLEHLYQLGVVVD